jgi:hypothetical protein
MPRGDYGPEIRQALGSSPKGRPRSSPASESAADMTRDVGKGIKEGSAQDTKLDAMPQNQARPPQRMPGAAMPTHAIPPDLPHVAAATSIAHAILGRRPGGA